MKVFILFETTLSGTLAKTVGKSEKVSDLFPMFH